MEMQTAKTLNTLAIGDRVIFRSSMATEYGTVTQVRHDGVVRVLWDSAAQSVQFSDLLVKRMPAPRLG
jgi:hypothetical protein